MVIADVSVLIGFAKIGRLNLLRRLFDSVAIAPAVNEEVVEGGLQVSAPEVIYVQQALGDGWLQVVPLNADEEGLKGRLLGTTSIDPGEAESLAIARLRNMAILVDDKQARTVARALGVGYMGSAAVLLEGCARGELSLEDLEHAVGELARVVWLSPDIVADILKRAREVSR
ncbi:MAG: hypothetical protein Q8O86_04205 [Dehalococcoidia bacterium]|nr:hypothetical protein [Dehalococcoidia bacterium]